MSSGAQKEKLLWRPSPTAVGRTTWQRVQTVRRGPPRGLVGDRRVLDETNRFEIYRFWPASVELNILYLKSFIIRRGDAGGDRQETHKPDSTATATVAKPNPESLPAASNFQSCTQGRAVKLRENGLPENEVRAASVPLIDPALFRPDLRWEFPEGLGESGPIVREGAQGPAGKNVWT